MSEDHGSKSKQRSKRPTTSKRSRAALADPECLGADVNALVTQGMVGIAKRQLGTVPVFWGRYFKGPGDQNPVRYQSQLEGPVLRANNIRVLPIAQQTNHWCCSSCWGRRRQPAPRPERRTTVGIRDVFLLDYRLERVGVVDVDRRNDRGRQLGCHMVIEQFLNFRLEFLEIDDFLVANLLSFRRRGLAAVLGAVCLPQLSSSGPIIRTAYHCPPR
jgi:hypothetical protein